MSLVLKEQFMSTRWARRGRWLAAGTECLENRACLRDTKGHWGSAYGPLKTHLWLGLELELGFLEQESTTRVSLTPSRNGSTALHPGTVANSNNTGLV